MVKLIVFQTNRDRATLCKIAARTLGIKEEDVFVTSDVDEDYAEAFVSGEKQLLITGTFNGNLVDAMMFVREAKRANPNLTAWFSSSLPEGGVLLFEREFAEKDFPIEFHDKLEYMMSEAKKFLEL